MNTININLSEATGNALRIFSEKNNISVDQFIVNAVVEKLAAFEEEGYIEERAKRAKSFDIKTFLAKVPDAEPDEFDKKRQASTISSV